MQGDLALLVLIEGDPGEVAELTDPRDRGAAVMPDKEHRDGGSSEFPHVFQPEGEGQTVLPELFGGDFRDFLGSDAAAEGAEGDRLPARLQRDARSADPVFAAAGTEAGVAQAEGPSRGSLGRMA